nr:hypothetical protein Q903MT_gene4644 [Picea sitchensis]
MLGLLGMLQRPTACVPMECSGNCCWAYHTLTYYSPSLYPSAEGGSCYAPD